MKKLKCLAMLLVGIVPAFAAEVFPLQFGNTAPSNEADSTQQQKYWDKLMSFKMWGTNGIEMGHASTPDISGSIGTADGNIKLINGDHNLGGPIYVGGSIEFGDGPDRFLSGPVRVTKNFAAGQNDNKFYGTYCIEGSISKKNKTTDDLNKDFKENGEWIGHYYSGSDAKTGVCSYDSIPEVPTYLSIPDVPALPANAVILPNDNNNGVQISGTRYFLVPPAVDGKKMYDFYINGNIQFGNDSKLVIVMQSASSLARYFINGAVNVTSSSKIQIAYVNKDAYYEDGEWKNLKPSEYTYVDNKDYAGNVLFHSKQPMTWPAMNGEAFFQGSFISLGTMELKSNLVLAGQLLAKNLIIGHEFDGKSFRYVPFDPPILKLEPEVGTKLEFPENDEFVIVPIKLEFPAKVDVYFDYCFEVHSNCSTTGKACIDDIGVADDDEVNHPRPICSLGQTAKVAILQDHDAPDVNNPNVSVWIKALLDDDQEGDEIVNLVISNLSGAVMPGDKREGKFALTIIDADKEPKTKTDSVVATEDVVFAFDSTKFAYTSAFDKKKKGIVITTLPAKGFLLYGGDTLKTANVFIPVDSVTDVDLQFINTKDGFGVNPAYTYFKFKVVDEDSVLSKTQDSIIVKVNPVNDTPTAFDTLFTIKENVAAGTVATGKIRVEDVDDTQFTYAFSTEDANYAKVTALYTINPKTGAISLKNGASLNYESLDSLLTIAVLVTDSASTTNGSGKFTVSADVTIKILDDNDKPVIRDTTFNVEENVAAGTTVGRVEADDEDIWKKLSFSLADTSANDKVANLFTITADGVIKVAEGAKLDFETRSEYTVYAIVTDNGASKGFTNLSDTAIVTIKLIDVNEPPIIIDAKDDYNVVENTASGVVFATIKILDVDKADGKNTLSVSLVDKAATSGAVTADQLFNASIVEGSGDTLLVKISVKDVSLLDYEALYKADTVSYAVALSITDANGASGSNTVPVETNIFVTDENEAPSAEDAEFSVAENASAGTEVGTVVAKDPDKYNVAYSTLHYSFVEQTTQFVINEQTGAITVAKDSVLDYETTPDHKITLHVQVTDGVTKPDTATVVVKLVDVNEPPVIDDDGKDYEVVENTPATTEIARYEIKDVDAVDADFATSLVVSLKDNATHSVKAESLFGTVVKAEGGKTYAVLQVKSVPNFEAIMAANGNDSTFNVTITLKDQKGAEGCNTVTLEKKITVRDVNEAPIIGETPIYTVKENSVVGTEVGNVPAYDEDLWKKLTFKLVDIPGGDDAASLFNIDNDGNITVAANANLDYETKNEYRVTVVVTDNGSSRGFTDLSAETVITIQVTDEDEKPGFDDKFPKFAVYENSKAGTEVGVVSATDDDCKDNTCAALKYTLVADTVAASASDYKEFKIDAATGKITVAKDSTLNYEVKNIYYALVVVSDGTLKDTARVTINIKDANDKPVIDNKVVSVPENSKAGTVVDTIPASDEDTWSSLTYKLVDVNPNDQVAKLFKVDNDGVITVAKDSTLDYETRKEYQVWVVVTDNGASRGFDNLSDTALVTIKVSDVNEPPEFIDDGKPDYKVAENTATGTEVARYEIRDPDDADANFATKLKVSLADNEQNSILAQSLFNIKVEKRNDTTFAVIRVASALDFEAIKEANGDTVFNVTLTLKDQNGVTGCNEVTLDKKIYVTDVNEKPDVKDAEFAVNENSKKGDSVGVVEASDPDKFNPNFGKLYYSLISSDAATTPGADTLFNIDDNGKITVAENATLNYEKTPVIYVKVRVTDKELSDTALVTVKLKDVDEKPKIIIDDGPDGEDDSDSLCIAHCDTTGRGVNPRDTLTVGIKENRATGTTVMAYTVSDEDFGEVSQLKTSLVVLNQSGADSLFGVHLVKVDTVWKVVVYVADSSKLDFEKVNRNHDVLIIVKDPKDLADTIVRVIQVIDVNEAPTLQPFNETIDENLPNESTVGALVAADPDSKNPAFRKLTYTILGADAVPFKLDSNVIKVADSKQLDYETTPTFKFKVEVSDGEFSDTALVTINLNEVNERPKIIIDDGPDGDDDSDTLCIAYCDTTNRGVDPEGKKTLTVGVKENSSTGTIVFAYVVTDEDVGEVGILKTDLIDNKGTGVDSLFSVELKKSGNTVKVVVTVQDGSRLDYETINPLHEVSVIVTDPRGLADTLVRKIEVIDVNEPPTFESWPFKFVEHNEPGTVVGHVEHGVDVDTTAISGISIPENYIHDQFELTGGADGADTLFKLLPNGDLVALKTFNYETDPHEYTIYISLMDTLMPQLVETDTIHISLLDINEDPWIVTDTVDVDENVKKGTVVDTVKAEDLDLYDTALTFTLVEDKSDCFEISKGGVVTVKKDNCPDLDYEKNSELPIKVKVTDSMDASETKTVIVVVKDVNEAPKIDDQTIHVSEDAKIGSVIDTVTASDPDTKTPEYSDLTYTIVGGDTTVFKIDPKTGVVTLKDSLDYEETSEYTLVVEVFDGEFRDTAKVTVKVDNVVEVPEVSITRAETVDTSWTNPDTLYINTTDMCIDWIAKNRKSGSVLKDTTECMVLDEGENIIIKKFDDPTMDSPGYDTLVVYVSKATPVVTVRKLVDDTDSPNIFTVVEQSAETDTSFYVNDRSNDLVITVMDPVSGSTEKFNMKVELDTVSVPSKTFTGTMAEIVDFGLALSDNPKSTTRTPVNGEKIAVTYTEEVNGRSVQVTYYTDNSGELIKNADGDVEITVSYVAEINGREVTISYQADAVTGAVIKTSGGYARPEDATAESSSSGKAGSSSSSGKDGKSSSSKGDEKKFENEVVYTVSYETVDETGNIITVSYGVDAEGNIVRNEDNNIGYLLTYTYTNVFGNSATQSIFIVLDQVPPAVKILYPTEGEIVYSNYVDVKWTVDLGDGRGPIVQDTLITQGLKKGGNPIVRFYRDKAGNEASDTIRVIMKNAKDVDIAVEQPVTEVTKDKVAEYYATNEPEEGQTFAVTIYNPKTDKEIETVIGGSFESKTGSEGEPYPGLPGHLGPTLAIETKVPTVNAVAGLATLDDIVNSDGLVLIDGVDADNSDKMPISEYVDKFCTDAFAEKVGSDLSLMNLYKTKMYVKVWIYTTLGSFVDYYSFTQDLDNPDYANDAGLLTLYFEMKPDRDGNVRTESGRLLATGAYLYKTEVEMKSELQCTLPPVKDETAKSSKKGAVRSVKEDMLKSFGYKRPNIK